jgi:putative RecB family exonuclease
MTQAPPPGERRPLPTRLSPSRASDFKRCPKLFEYKTILGFTTPNTIATARGTLFHLVFEHLFDFDRVDRTVENARSLVRPGWELLVAPDKADDEVSDPIERRLRDVLGLWIEQLETDPRKLSSELERAADYRALAPVGSQAEREIVTQVEQLVDNYFVKEIERVQSFDPEGREVHVQAQLDDLTLHGFIDRLDRQELSPGEERWFISDYKTGKPPQPQYARESFFGMRVYSLLLEEERGIRPYKLRLVYPSADRSSGIVDEVVDEALQQNTRRHILTLWDDIKACDESERWPTKKARLCNWCHFQNQCPAFT